MDKTSPKTIEGKTVPFKFKSTTSSKSFSDKSKIDFSSGITAPGRFPPTALIKTSMRPVFLTIEAQTASNSDLSKTSAT